MLTLILEVVFEDLEEIASKSWGKSEHVSEKNSLNFIM